MKFEIEGKEYELTELTGNQIVYLLGSEDLTDSGYDALMEECTRRYKANVN